VLSTPLWFLTAARPSRGGASLRSAAPGVSASSTSCAEFGFKAQDHELRIDGSRRRAGGRSEAREAGVLGPRRLGAGGPAGAATVEVPCVRGRQKETPPGEGGVGISGWLRE
jgi:hypothetical protein